jgi:hypothetical protein
MPEVMTTGFFLAGFAWTLWWNLDWRRYVKFYGIRNPSNHPLVVIGLRVFFAACSFGAADDLAQRLFQKTRSARFYWDSVLVAAAWFLVIVFMVKTIEWMNSKRARKHHAPS